MRTPALRYEAPSAILHMDTEELKNWKNWRIETIFWAVIRGLWSAVSSRKEEEKKMGVFAISGLELMGVIHCGT